jgi:HJR/Mrr/RecB family endonuclease
MLGDEKHKTFYIKLAKSVSKQVLMPIAKDVTERTTVLYKGAYFTKLLKEKGVFKNIILKKSWSKMKTKKSGQQKLKLRRSS